MSTVSIGRLAAALLALVLSSEVPGGGDFHVVAAAPFGESFFLRVAVAPADRQGLTVLRQADDVEGRPVAVETASAGPRDQHVLTVSCVPGEYVVWTATLVSLPLRLDAEACGKVRDVELFRSATISAAATVAAGRDLPLLVAVAVRTCAEQGRGREAGAYRVRVAPDGAFATPLPAGCVDPVVRAADLAPVPLGRVTLKPGERHGVGTVSLKPGATLSVDVRGANADPVANAPVWVIKLDDYARFLQTSLSLSFFESISATDPSVKKILATRRAKPEGTDYEGRTNARGEVNIVGAPTGLVYVVATSGALRGVVGPIELHAGELCELEPLTAAPPGTVTVNVAGDRGWLPPRASLSVQAHLVVNERLTSAPALFALSVDENVPRPLPVAGQWRFTLSLNGIALDTQDVEVLPGVNTPVTLTLARRAFPGRVVVGDLPTAGLLRLQRWPGASGREPDITAGDDGRFVARLREAGTYKATFSSRDRTVREASAYAEFVEGRDTTIRISLAAITGTVVLEDGEPAATAQVTLRYPPDRLAEEPQLAGESLTTTAADQSGSFTFPYVAAGKWEIRAVRTGEIRLVSDPQVVTVEDISPPPVRLVLRERAPVTVRVVNVRGEPVGHAEGTVLAPPLQPGGIPARGGLQTDWEGRGQLPVECPPGGAVVFQVSADGYPTAAFRVVPDDAGNVVLTMSPDGGQVRVIAPRDEGPDGRRTLDYGTYVLVNEEGGLVEFDRLARVSGTSPGTLVTAGTSWTMVIPALAAGRWQLAKFADARAKLLYVAGIGALPLVRTFTLTPGGTVVIDLR